MIISSITLNNYRLYRGLNKIDFKPEENKNIFLISGENGFGKTTFLHSLLWCLYGRLVADVEVNIRKELLSNGYNTLLKSNLNNTLKNELDLIDDSVISSIRKNGYKNDTEYLKNITQYYVSIEFSDVVIPSLPCTSLTVKRGYDYLLDKEFVEIYIDGNKNELTNEIGPDIFINDFILNKDIARFFFFDSEQIVALADTNTVAEKRKLCSAYNEVLGVRKYEDLKNNLENVRLRFRKKSSDIAGRDKLLALLARQEEIQKKGEELQKQLDSLDLLLLDFQSKNEELQLQLLREGNGTTAQEYERLQILLDVVKNKDISYKEQLKEYLDYAPLAIVGKLLTSAKIQIESDYKLKVSNTDLISRNIIVSDITSDLLSLIHKSNIAESQKREMLEQVQTVLKKYKGEVSTAVALTSLSEEDYNEFLSIYSYINSTYRLEFERLAEDYKKNKQVLERTSRKISTIQSKEGDELIKKLRNEKNVIEAEIAKITDNIKNLHMEIGVVNQELATISKQVSELSKRVNLSDVDSKKDEVASKLISELDTFLYSLKQEKKYSLERRIKTILNVLMHKDDFIGEVEVAIVGDSMDINLFASDGSKINKESLSKGEQQLYATSILKALVEESNIQFPVFIDSPLQKFDKSHATKIITEFYPTISKQVILFPLLYKELTPEELDVMKPLVNSAYLIKNDVTRSFFDKIDVNELMPL